MIDFLHLPKPQNGYVEYFIGNAVTLTTSWQVWNKPRGINFIRITCIGGGGGGNRGISSATTTARGGSGGGGSGGVATVMIPAIFLPDRLYVSPGASGRRGTAGGNGADGGISNVCIAQDTGSIYTVCYANGGDSGTVGAPTGGGGGGAAGSFAVLSSALQAGMGNFAPLVGQVGGSGGAQTGAVGTSIIYPTTGLLLSGGGGGAGGAGFAGGDITAPASQTSTYTIFPTLSGGAAGTAGSLAGGDGAAGVNNMELMLFTGGSGGGSGFDGTAGSVGGRGGDGGIGCGGGGGGGGTTGGEGGNGGPGLVIISCW